MRRQHGYARREDPADRNIPLAWVFERDGKRVGRRPPGSGYKKIEIAGTGVQWLVHCSFAGAITFLLNALGDKNVDVVEGEKGTIHVPEYLVGSWIGNHACVVGFLKQMLGVEFVHVVGESDWDFN